jgi:hypothetical protein
MNPPLDTTLPQAEQECYEQAEGTGRQAGWTARQVTSLYDPPLDTTLPQAEQECYEQAEGTGRQAGWTARQVTSLHGPWVLT